MYMDNFKNAICLLIFVFALSGCQKDEIIIFDNNNNAGLSFIDKNEDYSFLKNTTGEHIFEIGVSLVGDVVDYDREVSLVVVDDTTTTAPSDLFEIQKGVVKAGEFEGTVPVKVLNHELLTDSIVYLSLTIEQNEHFSFTIKEKDSFKLGWTDKVIVPPSNAYFRAIFCNVNPISTSCYRVFVEVTGLTVFGAKEYSRTYGDTGSQALGNQFGDYIKQWNLDNPDNPLLHDDGPNAGEPIIPRYYTRSIYD